MNVIYSVHESFYSSDYVSLMMHMRYINSEAEDDFHMYLMGLS